MSRVANIGLMLLMLFTPTIFAATHVTANSYQDVQKIALKLGKKYGPNHVLLAFDVDNTLLTSNSLLGSERWLLWQDGLLAHHPSSPQLVAHTQQKLAEMLTVFYILGRTHLTENSIPKVLTSLQADGFRTIVLTARRWHWRDFTMRELRANNLHFGAGGLRLQHGFSGLYFLNTDQGYKLVSYLDGVMLCNFFDKGIVLRSLLKRVTNKIRAVIFVDDMLQNSVDVTKALNDTGIHVVTIRYSRMDAQVKSFNAKEKAKATRQWLLFKKIINHVFGN